MVPSGAVVSVEYPTRWPKTMMLRRIVFGSAPGTGLDEAQAKRSSPITVIRITPPYPTLDCFDPTGSTTLPYIGKFQGGTGDEL